MRMVSWSIRRQSAGTWLLNMGTAVILPPLFFYGEDTLVDNEDLPVVKKNPFFTSNSFVHSRYPARDNYDWEQWRDPGRTGRYR